MRDARRGEIRAARERRLSERHEDAASGISLIELDGCYQFCTKAYLAVYVKRALELRKTPPLSKASLEVLAIVAYNQPVTRAYVEQVRGVDSSSIIASLVEKGLLEEAGRLELPGRPICYQTTPNFLRTFGLSSLEELPLTEPAPGDDLPEDLIEGQIGFDDPGVSAGE